MDQHRSHGHHPAGVEQRQVDHVPVIRTEEGRRRRRFPELEVGRDHAARGIAAAGGVDDRLGVPGAEIAGEGRRPLISGVQGRGRMERHAVDRRRLAAEDRDLGERGEAAASISPRRGNRSAWTTAREACAMSRAWASIRPRWARFSGT